MGVFLLIAGTVIVLAGLGLLRMPRGGRGIDAARIMDQVMTANKGYPVRAVNISTGSESVGLEYPLNNVTPERYGGMDAEAMAEELRQRGENGPGPNHPG